MTKEQTHPRDLRMVMIGMVYRVHGGLLNLFQKPGTHIGLARLEGLVLGVIVDGHKPFTVSQIGRELGFSRQSVQRAMNKLVDLGLAKPDDNPRHKRAPIFLATELGEQRMYQVQEPSRQLAASIVDQFDDARAQSIIDDLGELLTAINKRCEKEADD